MTKLELKIDWLALFLLLVPTFYVVGVDMRLAQANFFQLAVFTIIALVHVNKFIRYFLLYAMVQYLAFPLPISLFQLQNLFLGALAYDFVVRFTKDERIKWYLWLLLGFMAFNCAWAILQVWNIDPIFMVGNADKQPDGFKEGIGFFGLQAMMGNYAAAILPISLLLMPVTAGFCLIGLFISKSTFSVIAAVIAGAFLLWFRKRLYFWIMVVAGSITALLYITITDLPSGQFSRRLNAWHHIAKEGFKTQWIGKGLGTLSTTHRFCEVTPTHQIKLVENEVNLLAFLKQQADIKGNKEVRTMLDSVNAANLSVSGVRHEIIYLFSRNMQLKGMDVMPWVEAHNEFIQVFFEMGLIGLAIMLAFIGNLFKRFYLFGTKSVFCITMAASFLAIVIVSVGHFPFHVARLSVPFLVIAAFFEKSLLKAEGQ